MKYLRNINCINSMPKNVNFNFNISVVGVIVIIIIIVAAVIFNQSKPGNSPGPSGPSKYDDFAKCLTEKGAKMYGAFWCPHCQNQKAEFSSSFQYVNYQECTVNGQQNSFAQACQDAGIKGYPTWKFPDGTVKEGEVPLADLAKITGCVLPQ